MTNYIDLLKYCPQCAKEYHPENIDKTGILKCSNCKFKNYVKSFPTVCAIIPNQSREILMVQRAFDPGKGEYDPPGGYVNYGESAEDAVKREIKEELDLDITIDKVLHTGKTAYIQNDINYPTVVICFLIKPISSESIRLSNENVNFKYFKVEDIIQNKVKILWEPVLEAIKIYAEELTK